MRLPPLLASLLIVAALGGTLALADEPDSPFGRSDEPESAPQADFDPASDREIAMRLERIRALEFDEVPDVRTVSAEEWREKTARKAKDGAGSAADQREAVAVADFLKLAGLAAPDFDIAQATQGVGELIGGFYRPKSNRLVLVEQPLQGPVGEEGITAHELDHALQDQNFPDSLKLGKVDGEAELGLSALVEGDATVVERRYERRYLGVSAIEADKALLSPANLAVGLPPALVASVRFPYTAGADFVANLERRGGWELVDEAFDDPPTTTEQILHPAKWIAREEGEELDLDLAGTLGDAWRSEAVVESGELDAIVILAAGVPSDVAARAAKGWEGGAFEVMSTGPSECEGTCRHARAAALAYRWESTDDAEEFALAAARYLSERVSEGRREGLTFPVKGGGAAALAVDGETTAIGWAPSPQAAERLAASGSE